jgi:hypothetical protein
MDASQLQEFASGTLLFASTFEDGTLVTLFSPLDSVLWVGVKHRIPRGVWVILPQRCSMELALFVVVVIVAGAVIPGDLKIRFYR